MKPTSLLLVIFVFLCAPATSHAQEQYETPKTMPFQPIPKELLGSWTLGPYFHFGTSNSYGGIDVETLIGMPLTITESGFEFMGYKCEADAVVWMGETGKGNVTSIQTLPLEEKFEYNATHSVLIKCDLFILSLPDSMLPFFLNEFNIYYSDTSVTITYSPWHGPEFILKKKVAS